eukprot:3345296-Prymnesium_polylepis.1
MGVCVCVRMRSAFVASPSLGPGPPLPTAATVPAGPGPSSPEARAAPSAVMVREADTSTAPRAAGCAAAA